MTPDELLAELTSLILSTDLPPDRLCQIANAIIQTCGGKATVDFVETDHFAMYVINE